MRSRIGLTAINKRRSLLTRGGELLAQQLWILFEHLAGEVARPPHGRSRQRWGLCLDEHRVISSYAMECARYKSDLHF